MALMIGIVQKSIIKEMLFILPVTVVCLNTVLMMEKILQFSRFLSGVGASFSGFISIIIYIQPQLLILTLPMSFLIAVLIAYGRMNMDSEIVAMRAAGMSMRQISLPAVIAGIAVFFITLSMTFYVSPVSSKRLRILINEIIETRAPLSLEEGVFHNKLEGVTLLVGDKPSPSKMRDIFIYDTTDKNRPKLITSRTGRIVFNKHGDPVLDAGNGYIDIVHQDSFTEIGFKRYVFKINFGHELLSKKRSETPPLKLLEDTGRTKGRRQKKLFTEFHRRLTLPLMNIFLILLAPALSMTSGKSGRLAGFIYGIAVFGAYYFLLIYVEGLIHSGKIHHLFAWGPILIIGTVSFVIYAREARK